MAARNNKQVKSLLSQISNFIKLSAKKADNMEQKSEGLSEALKTQAIAKGRSFKEIMFDDAAYRFVTAAALLKLNIEDFDEDSIRLDVYRKLLEARNGEIVSKEDAEKKFESDFKKRVNEIGGSGSVKPIPDCVKIAAKSGDKDLQAQVQKDWEQFSSILSESFSSPEALVSHSVNAQLTHALRRVFSEKAQTQTQPKKLPAASSEGNSQGEVKEGKIDPELAQLLAYFGEDVTAKVAKDKTAEVTGRESETEQTLATLIKKQNPYALNHGPAGAGVSAVTNAVAQQIVKGKVPAALKDAQIIRLKFREMKAHDGNSQKEDPLTGNPMSFNLLNDRLRTILDKVSAHNERGGPQIILNVTELQDFEERFPLSQSKNILTTAMSETNSLKIIAELSDEQKYQIETGSAELIDLFTPTLVKPLSIEQTISVLQKEVDGRSEEEKRGITDDLLKFIVEKSDRYIAGVAQPKAGLAVLDSAIAKAQIRGEELNKGHIAEVVSMNSGIPKEFIDSSLSKDIATLAEKLPSKVMGQEQAMTKIAASLEDANEGINDPNKPLGVFFMPGATGVGKTYTAETLADLLHMPLVTIDMGNYQDKHAKAKLIGAPPGYVGYSDTPEMQKVKPFSVVLLDEFEKAHQEVQNIFLSAFDKGRLQLLNNGQEIDLRNCVVFMTSNLGAREASVAKDKGAAGFGVNENMEEANQKLSRDVIDNRIKEELSPEFLNRVTVLYFNDLTEDVVKRIALREINKVSDFLQSKNENLKLTLTEQAIDDLMSIGFDPKFGARPMERAALESLKRPINAWYKENGTDISEPTEVRVSSLKDEFKAEAVKLSAQDGATNDNKPPQAPPRSANGPSGPSL